MSKRIVSILFVLVICFYPAYARDISIPNQIIDDYPQPLYKEALIDVLFPDIYDEVKKHYSRTEDFSYDNVRILNIEKKKDKIGLIGYEIIIQVDTFKGPHNPPHGLDTITFLTSPSGIKVANYKHEAE